MLHTFNVYLRDAGGRLAGLQPLNTLLVLDSGAKLREELMTHIARHALGIRSLSSTESASASGSRLSIEAELQQVGRNAAQVESIVTAFCLDPHVSSVRWKVLTA